MSTKLIERFVSYIRRAKTQEQIIKYLRTLKFEFFEYSTIALKFPDVKILETHQKYQFLVRSTGIWKSDFDTRLIVGIKITGRKTNRMVIYKDNEFSSMEVKEWGKIKRVNFKKVKAKMKFDKSMTYKERKIWRAEHEKLKKKPSLKPSQFYWAHKHHVQFL